MSPTLKTFTTALIAGSAILLSANYSQAQVTVKVDSTKNWVGWMNRFDTNGTYLTGSGWGTADLRGNFVPAKTNATRVLLQINTNTYSVTDPTEYWNLSNGVPNKFLEANFYVDAGASLAGQDVTFVGTVESNTLPPGWTCEAVIKEFGPGYNPYLGDTRQAVVGGTSFSVNRIIGAGNITQYGFLTYGPNAAPGSPDALQAASIIIDNADPSITSDPTGQRVVIGGTASFSVAASGGTPLSYQWKRYDTNIVNAVGKFAGATSPTLTISNAQASDDTTYTVTVTDTAGSLTTTPVRLRVLTAAQFANYLDNPSFEDYDSATAYGLVPSPWFNFTGSALLTVGDLFIYTNAYDGSNVVQVYNGGEYSGIYQDVPAVPGQIFTGDCWLWQSSLDPLSSSPIHEAFLEVQFWSVAGATPIAMHQSYLVNSNTPYLDTWLHLEATNGVAAGYAQTSTSNGKYLVAPAGTSRVRFQITSHAVGGGAGSVFVDAMQLLKKTPVTVTTTVTGGSITLAWPTELTSTYQVVYKNNLSDLTWTPVNSPVVGDGTVKSANFTTTSSQRFYSVLTQ